MADPAAVAREPAATAPAVAPAPAPVAPTKAKAAEVDANRVCRLEPLLGSRMKSVVCYSCAQMAERTAYDKANLDKIQAATPGPF